MSKPKEEVKSRIVFYIAFMDHELSSKIHLFLRLTEHDITVAHGSAVFCVWSCVVHKLSRDWSLRERALSKPEVIFRHLRFRWVSIISSEKKNKKLRKSCSMPIKWKVVLQGQSQMSFLTPKDVISAALWIETCVFNGLLWKCSTDINIPSGLIGISGPLTCHVVSIVNTND